MRILFIYPDMVSPDPTWTGYYYEGLAVLSACARRAGHETELLHVYKELPDEEIVRWVEERRDEHTHTLLAFSSTTNQFPHVKRWAPLLKRETGLPTIVGGMHPTLSPEDAIAQGGVDMICKGDGEGALVEVAGRLERGESLEGAQGIWFRDGAGEVVRQGSAALANIDSLPTPHWEVFSHFPELMVIREGIGIHMGSRGCPYTCAYCCNVALIEDAKGVGKFMRFKDVEILMQELELYLQRNPKTWGFFFEDDIFGVSKKWLRRFAEVYPKRIGKPFGCNMRPNMVDDWMVGCLAESGCVRVHMAVESGNEEIRNKILNRKLSQEKLVRSFQLFKERGIQTLAYNIVGSPHETPMNIVETIKVNAEIEPEHIQHSIFYPYEGTPLYDLVERENLWAKDREVTNYFTDTAIEQDCISRDQVLMFQNNFKRFVRHYARLKRLPAPLGRLATAATDLFLTWGGAPRVMRWTGNDSFEFANGKQDGENRRDQREAATQATAPAPSEVLC